MSLPSSPAIVSFSSRPEVSLSSVRFSAVNHADTRQKQEQRTAAEKEADGDEREKAQLQSGVGPRGPRDLRSRGSSSFGVRYQDDDWRVEVQRQEHYQVCLYVCVCARAPVHLQVLCIRNPRYMAAGQPTPFFNEWTMPMELS